MINRNLEQLTQKQGRDLAVATKDPSNNWGINSTVMWPKYHILQAAEWKREEAFQAFFLSVLYFLITYTEFKL